jgi:hypothetical protein
MLFDGRSVVAGIGGKNEWSNNRDCWVREWRKFITRSELFFGMLCSDIENLEIAGFAEAYFVVVVVLFVRFWFAIARCSCSHYYFSSMIHSRTPHENTSNVIRCCCDFVVIVSRRVRLVVLPPR